MPRSGGQSEEKTPVFSPQARLVLFARPTEGWSRLSRPCQPEGRTLNLRCGRAIRYHSAIGLLLFTVHEAVIANDNNSNIAVAVDGTWHKRGYSSLNGVVCATSVENGKVVDFEALTKYCSSYTSVKFDDPLENSDYFEGDIFEDLTVS
ncbi:hypothetical protein TNCV_3655921 [Trichonephila clavipes]|nr:hypothetical protein TNCV_3655921 [Trichonephila clavipes]